MVAQSLLGVPTPATAGTSGGYAPAQEARENCYRTALVRKARLALARPGGHQLLRLACLRSITSACGRRVGREPPRGVDPRTRRYKGRGPAGAGGVVPTGGLAPPRLAAPGFGSGVLANSTNGAGSWSLSGSNRPPPHCK